MAIPAQQLSRMKLYTARGLVVFLEAIGLLIFFLIALKMMILSFKLLNIEVVEQIILATSNPFLSLFIGLLTTALIHSSSTITAMTIAIVASGTISIESAVYMIMGANIGTTVTATIVALGHATRKKEFRKAISASMVHHFYNVFSTILLFPLEFYFGFLSGTSRWLASFFTHHSLLDLSYFNPIDSIIVPIAFGLLNLLGNMVWLGLIVSCFLIFYALQLASSLFKKHLLSQPESLLEKYLFGKPFPSLIAGTLITTALQSSTVVTSLLVPIVATNKLSIKRVFPFIIGANMGTTFKAIFASLATTESAFTIAICHLMFNLLGILVFFPFPAIRNIPVIFARRIGKLTLKNRFFGFAYISLIFFIVPFILIYFSQEPISIKQYNYRFEQKAIDSLSNKNLAPKTRLFYKQVRSTKESKMNFAFGNKHTFSRDSTSITFNRKIFYTNKLGRCWEDKDEGGNYEMCLRSIERDFKLNHTFRFDSCYVFVKQYSASEKKAQKYYYYITPDKPKLIKTEIQDLTSRKIIFREELINITVND
jgi:solute carrier family 34 (sodium-dependent phosphate cotransporter)